MSSWLLFNVFLPLGLPLVLGVVALMLANQNERISGLVRDGSLLMYCLLSAFDLVRDLGELRTAQHPQTLQIDYALVASVAIIAISSVVFTNNIRVDERKYQRGRLAETIAAGGTLVITLTLIMYYRLELGLF